jgi:hypothetical protein
MAEPGVARCSGSATLLRLKEGPHLIANSPGTEHILEPRPTKPYLIKTIDPFWRRISWMARVPPNSLAPVRIMLIAGSA